MIKRNCVILYLIFQLLTLYYLRSTVTHMKSHLLLDGSSDIPIYQQIINHFEKAILIGELNPGDYLPSVREFSVQHHVNPNTVSRAYQIIQALKLVEAMRGSKLKVMPLDNRSSELRKHAILTTSIDALFSTGQSLQISADDLLREIRTRMKSHYSSSHQLNRKTSRAS